MKREDSILVGSDSTRQDILVFDKASGSYVPAPIYIEELDFDDWREQE